MTLHRLFQTCLVLVLAGCTGYPFPAATSTPASQATATVASPVSLDATEAPPGPLVLRVWAPPEFDPASGTAAGNLLKERLEAFTASHNELQIEVRVKAMTGAGGMLESLTAASAAAPLALPDLVALPRPVLETAALKGMLHPFDDLIGVEDNPDWFNYARQMGRLQNSTFGLPCAGDVLVLVYRTTKVASPPTELEALLESESALIFPAADPQALFTLAIYQALGGELLDASGRPQLDASVLTSVLTLYQEGAKNERMPLWLTQIENDQQAWQAFREGHADMLVTWISSYLREMPAGTAATRLPTPGGAAFTLATGWVWAMASSNPEHHLPAAQLAAFLSEADFLAGWNTQTGYLPPHASALKTWQSPMLRDLAQRIAPTARLYPSADVLSSLAPPLLKATIQVLKQQSLPEDAAQDAAQSLINP